VLAPRLDGEAPYPRTIAGLAVLFTGHHLRFQSSQQGALCRAETWHMPALEGRFKLEKETKGALRYQEVDEKGESLAKIGTLYVRKSAFERKRFSDPTL
jgi:hypothetical protein